MYSFLTFFCVCAPLLSVPLMAQTDNPNKVDDDGDGLIEIWSLTDLNNMRHNLAGTSYKAASNAAGDDSGCGTGASLAVGGATGRCHGYELMIDLDFRADSDSRDVWQDDENDQSDTGWPPIAGKFSGTFEGNGHVIKNLYVNASASAGPLFAGLFAYLSGAKVRNLGLTGEHMSVAASLSLDTSVRSLSNYPSVGSLAGGSSYATIENCYATGNVAGKRTAGIVYNVYAGGLVGRASGTLTNCYTTGDVTATNADAYNAHVGGLVGYGRGSLTISGSYATGDVTATASHNAHAGGLVGHTINSISITDSRSVRSSYFAGAVTATGERLVYAGGLVGRVENRAPVTVQNSHSTGSVTAKSTGTSDVFVGGLIGIMYGVAPPTTDYTITRSHSASKVTGTGGGKVYAGGLLGWLRESARTRLTNSHSTGSVTATSSGSSEVYVGGLVGDFSAAAADKNIFAFMNCYATASVTGTSAGQIQAGGLVGFLFGNIVFRNNYSTGNVIATSSAHVRAGGLVGKMETAGSLIDVPNCYSKGDISARSTSGGSVYAGGFVGLLIESDTRSVTNITNSYSIAAVTGTSTGTVRTGGLIGGVEGTRFGFRKRYVVKAVNSVTNSYHSGPNNAKGTPKTKTELKALTAESAKWSTLDWWFGTAEQYPVLREYGEDGEGNRVPLGLLRGQNSAPFYRFASATTTSLSLAGQGVPEGMVRRVFVHTSTLSRLSVPSAVDAGGGPEGVINFDLKTGSGTSLTIGAGGQGRTLKANTAYYIRMYDYRESDHAFTEVSKELVAWTTPREPGGYALSTSTTSRFALTGEIVPEGLTRHFFVSKLQLPASVRALGERTSSSNSDIITFTAKGVAGASTEVGSLDPNTKYYVRMYDYRESDRAVSAVSAELMVWTAPAIPATYSPITSTANRFTLTGDGVPMGLTRHFFIGKDPLPVSTHTLIDKTSMPNSGIITFTVEGAAGERVVVGAGSRHTDNRALSANTKYYVRTYDYRSDKVLSEISEQMEIWTQPATPGAISGMDARQITQADATTQEYRLGTWENLKIHWVLVETEETDPSGLDGTKIVGLSNGTISAATTDIGTNDWASAKTRSKGSLMANGVIMVSGLSENTGYVLFVVAEGTGAGGQSEDRVVVQDEPGFRFQTLPLETLSYTASATDNTIVLTGGGAVPTNTTRRVYVSEAAIPNFTSGIATNGAYVGGGTVAGESFSFGEGVSLTMGAEGDIVKTLDANKETPYYIYLYDHRFNRRVSRVQELRVWTRYAVSAYASVAHTVAGQIKFTSTNDIPSGATRRFHLSKGSLSGVSLLTPSDGQLSGGSDVRTFVLSSSDRAKDLIIGQGATPPANLSLDANVQYYLRAYDYKSDAKHSELSEEVQSHAVSAPSSPLVLEQKRESLTQNAQVYTVTFTGGTLWYLLRQGEKDTGVTPENIKQGTGAVGANKGSVAETAQTKEVSLRNLSPGTEYTLYAFVEGVSLQSEIVAQTFTTSARPSGNISVPSYILGTPTQSTLTLTEGSRFSGGANRRRFFVSKNDLNPLVVTDAKKGTSSGVEGEVWTFVLNEDITEFVIGSGTPEENKALEPNTRYHVRAMDYASSDGRKSDLSDDLGGTTAKPAPPPEPNRVFGFPNTTVYAYPNPTSGLLCVPVSSGVAVVFGSDGSEVGSFEVSAGQIDLAGLPAGSYILRLNDTHWVRVMKE